MIKFSMMNKIFISKIRKNRIKLQDSFLSFLKLYVANTPVPIQLGKLEKLKLYLLIYIHLRVRYLLAFKNEIFIFHITFAI